MRLGNWLSGPRPVLDYHVNEGNIIRQEGAIYRR